MIIIADSGSSKTNWIISDLKTENLRINTTGLNPNFSSSSIISSVVNENIAPFVQDNKKTRIFFYGSGCSDRDLCNKVNKALKKTFPDSEIEVYSDLLGAARALLGNRSGIACILGTGSNSGFYDGKSIIMNIPPLGFILGDEGGGAYLGKRLLSDYLKGIMPEQVSDMFSEKYHADKDLVIQKVYRGEFPGRYIASFVVFLKDNISNPYCSSLVEDAFSDFISRNIRFYDKFNEVEIAFTGSIAWHFQDILRKVTASYRLKTGEILKEPAERIMEYHIKEQL